jgi:hypothetical protein
MLDSAESQVKFPVNSCTETRAYPHQRASASQEVVAL